MELLHSTFKQNTYSDVHIHHTLNSAQREDASRKKPTMVIFLPFARPTFNCHWQGAKKMYNIKTVCLLPRKVMSFLQPIKDYLGFKTLGIYSIPHEHGKVYIGQTGCSIETRIKKHHQHIRLYHLDKSAVAKYSINLGHHTPFQDTSILGMKSRHTEYIIREATD
jgi:hypothetical protein